MAKIPQIAEHARKIKAENYYLETWQCKHCKKQYVVRYQDFSALRAHMRRMHRIHYHPYVIDEEVDLVASPA